MRIILLSKYNKNLIEQISKIYNSAFQNSVFRTWNEKDFLDLFNMGSKFYLLYMDNNIIAYAIFFLEAKIAEVISIGVYKKEQKRGYGKILIDNFISENKNISRLSLEVARSNYNAISFYKYIGFYNVGVRKDYYLIRRGVNKGKKIDAIVMEKIINK